MMLPEEELLEEFKDKVVQVYMTGGAAFIGVLEKVYNYKLKLINYKEIFNGAAVPWVTLDSDADMEYAPWGDGRYTLLFHDHITAIEVLATLEEPIPSPTVDKGPFISEALNDGKSGK